MTSSTAFDRAHTDDLIHFVTASPTPYHAVSSAARRLADAGFRESPETDAWSGEPGGYYLVRGGTLIAWYVPDDARDEPTRPFRVVGAHTDSPNLRVKPHPDLGAFGWRQIGVEVYGAPLLHTWLDRDLGLAGRLVLRDGSVRLVDSERPLLRVPQLAIHLDRTINETLRLDKQHHLTPVWGLGQVHEGDLITYVAELADVPAAEIAGWDLMTYDSTPPACLGRDRELFAAPRLDNLLSVHAAISALLKLVSRGLPAGASVPMVAAFDHEEIGSTSDTGAQSTLLGRVLDRLVTVRGGSFEDRARALAASVVVSSDVGHAVHPNHPERHDPQHRPVPNGGPILKVNATQRYTTDAHGRAIWAAACERANVPWQIFVSNNSVPCGSTIGPFTSAQLGVRTLDVGVALLSMHSVRELGGVDDPYLHAAAMLSFFEGREL